MSRRPDRGLLALLPPLIGFLIFGAARVVAPVGLIGLLFDHPWAFAVTATVLGLAGVGLLFIRPIELRVAAVLVPSRAPTPAEETRVRELLDRVGAHAGMSTDRLIVRIEDDGEMNASAGAAHLIFVTTAALRQPEEELEALLAHELGHHRGLHPLATAFLWWLSLPGVVLVAVYNVLRRLALRLTGRLRPLALVVRLALFVWQVSVMWLYYIAQLLALRAARVSEFTADRHAADWGYREPLARLFAKLGESPPTGLIGRLLATHPPTEERAARLARVG